MNPFDLHTVLFAKHAQHVVLIHFPIALYLAGVLFDLLSRGRKESPLAFAAYFNFSFAAVMTIPVIVTGILAWQFALEGQKLKGVLLLHMVLAWLSAASIALVWWIHRQARRKEATLLPSVRIVPELAGVLLITLTAHLGGFLSGVNG
jgi:uncharacterized membrane protein